MFLHRTTTQFSKKELLLIGLGLLVLTLAFSLYLSPEWFQASINKIAKNPVITEHQITRNAGAASFTASVTVSDSDNNLSPTAFLYFYNSKLTPPKLKNYQDFTNFMESENPLPLCEEGKLPCFNLLYRETPGVYTDTFSLKDFASGRKSYLVFILDTDHKIASSSGTIVL